MDGLWRSHTKNKGCVSKPNRIKVILCWFCCRAGPTTVTSFSLLSMCGKPRLMEGHRVCVLVFWATESLDSKTKSSSVTLTCRQQWDKHIQVKHQLLLLLAELMMFSSHTVVMKTLKRSLLPQSELHVWGLDLSEEAGECLSSKRKNSWSRFSVYEHHEEDIVPSFNMDDDTFCWTSFGCSEYWVQA